MVLTVKGPATGSTLTGHDALYAYPADMQHNGTLLAGTAADVGCPRITLADNVDQRVKWVWAIPVDWDAIAVRWGSSNENVATGNVRWQFAYKLIYLGEGNIDGAVTTISIAALSSGGQFDFLYNTPAELVSIPTVNGGFGDKPFMLCSLARLGLAGPGNGDTLAGGVSVMVTTATRVDI